MAETEGKKVHQIPPRAPKAAPAAPVPIESSVGRGVEMVVEGSTLTITIDLARNFGASKTGKTLIIASTDGNIPIVGAKNGAVMGLNIYRKP